MGVGETILAVGAGARPASFEQFAAAIDAHWITDALAATNAASVRRRNLLVERVVWLVIAMALFRHRSIAEVVRHLDLVLPRPDEGRGRVSNAGIVQARPQLARHPLDGVMVSAPTSRASSRSRFLLSLSTASSSGTRWPSGCSCGATALRGTMTPSVYFSTTRQTLPEAATLGKIFGTTRAQVLRLRQTAECVGSCAAAKGSGGTPLWPNAPFLLGPIMSLVRFGVNGVTDFQRFTQAAWRNRLPVSGWALRSCVAMGSRATAPTFGEARGSWFARDTCHGVRRHSRHREVSGWRYSEDP
jgi:hypothetical protein